MRTKFPLLKINQKVAFKDLVKRETQAIVFFNSMGPVNPISILR